MANVPVVDAAVISAAKDGEPSDDELADFGRRLRDALADCGFAIVTGHGIPSGDVDAALEAARDFFDLKEEDKMEYVVGRHSKYGGYIRKGKEKIDVLKTDTSRYLVVNVTMAKRVIVCFYSNVLLYWRQLPALLGKIWQWQIAIRHTGRHVWPLTFSIRPLSVAGYV